MNNPVNRIQRMSDHNLSGKRVLIREDLNVPIQSGIIMSDARLQAALPAIRSALEQQAAVIVMSHLGRPQEGQFDPALSLAPVAQYLSTALSQPVPLVQHDQPVTVAPGECVLLENVRFNSGELTNDPQLAQSYAKLAEVFVMDAFGSSHRAQASTAGVAQYAPLALAGPLLCAELDALTQAVQSPKAPLIAIVGGAKVSGKLAILERLADIADSIIVGGGIANTFIAAKGFQVGKSLYEPDLIPKAQAIMDKIHIPIPVDVLTAARFDADATAECTSLDNIGANDLILDVGPATRALMTELITQAGTLLWNGPIGVFEFDAFSEGTAAVGRAIADSQAFSIAGGGDTLAAIERFGLAEQISYISTGGGAFLEFIEGKELPAVVALKSRATGMTTAKTSVIS